MLKSFIATTSALLLTVILAACQPTVYQKPPPYFTLINRGNKGIASLLVKKCGETDSEYKQLNNEQIMAGTAFQMDLISGCLDFKAIDASGYVLGRQTGMHIFAGGKWLIK